MYTRFSALVAAALAVMVLGLACGGTRTVMVVVTPTDQPATATSENVSPVEEAEARVDDAMAELASLVVELVNLDFGPAYCDIFLDGWQDINIASYQAAAVEIFVEPADLDMSDWSLNEVVRMGELIVEECARQGP